MMNTDISAPPDPGFARLILDSATDFAIFTSDDAGTVTSWNVGAEALFGWSAADAIGHDGAMIFTSEDRDAGAPEDERKRARADGRAVNERWHVRRDGTRFWGSGLMMPLRGADAGFVKMMRDRTAERQAQRRFHTMTATLPGFVFTADIDGHYTETNELFRDHTGRTAAELNGDGWLDALHPDDRERVAGAWRQAVATGEPFKQRYRIRGHDDVYRCFDCRALPERDELARTVRWLGTCIDVETEAQALTQLEQLNRNLEQQVAARTAELHAEVQERLRIEEALRHSQRLESLGQLTGGIAHDFNNLLTIIRSSADLLRRTELGEDKRRRYIAAIADTADRAAKLTGQLLAFARRQTLTPELFDAGERLSEIGDMLSSVAGSAITLDILPCRAACAIEADPSQFESALVNLVANARDAMDGQGRLRIGVASADEVPARRGHAGGAGDFVAITVEDDGHGMPPDTLERIFEPFFTTKDVGKGTGLGLSQVFGFVKQSGGEVDVRSVPGAGTIFTLYLPRRHVEAHTAKPGGTDGAPLLGHGRILLVEDNRMVGEFATSLLEELGYHTRWAENAQVALATLERSPDAFDAVFTDVVMPGMNGVELATTIRRLYPALPVVLTSGYSHVLAEQGTHGFELLRKPYSAEALARTLARLVRAE